MVHFQLSGRAYAKLICHSAKYPDREINGALIGTISKKDNRVQIQDTIPLFHIELGVAPMIEVALNQVELYASSKGLTIVGYYQANETIDDTSINETAACIGKRISTNCDTSCILMVCNDTVLQQEDNSISLKMFTCSDSSSGVWREQKELSVINGDQTIPAVKKLIFNGVYKKLIDFDNHLENVNDDWTNTDINKAIEGI